MRILSFLFVFVGTTGAFQIRPISYDKSVRTALLSKAEEHLEELANEWEALQTRVKAFAGSPALDESKAKEFTVEILKTAIDHAHTKEEIEEEHVQQAHQEFEQALMEEDFLKIAMPFPHDSTDQWMEPHRMYFRLWEDGTLLPPDKMHYQYLVNEDDPVNGKIDRPASFQQLLKDYQKSRLEVVHEKEEHAQKEEVEAKRTLEELQKKEELLKETLEELEVFQEEKQKKEEKKDLKNKVDDEKEEDKNRQKMLNDLNYDLA